MDLTLAAIVGMYAFSLLLVVWPLGRIILQRQLREYMTYFVATAGFLFLNLLGTSSPNVLSHRSLTFHLTFLLLSLFLNLTFFVLQALTPRGMVPMVQGLVESCRATSRVARRTSWLLFWASAACVAAVARWFTPPLYLQTELLGRWPELVERRVEIVLSGSFHWLSLGFFEIPLFIVILADVYRRTLRRARPAEGGRWTRMYALFIPVSFAFSVYFLNKQYAIYLLAAVALVSLVDQRHLRLRTLTMFGVGSLVVLILLYVAFVGLEVQKILAVIGHRTFEVYPWSAAVTFDMFPKEEPFLLGRSILNPFGMFSYEFVNLADMTYPRIYGETSFGSAPVPAVFESYANFGFMGMAISALAIFWLIWAATLMSWSQNAFVFSLSVYWSLKLALLWQGPFWFGTLDPSLIVFTGLLVIVGAPLWLERTVRLGKTAEELPRTKRRVSNVP